MNRLKSISIGIPAFNEAKNIGMLLTDISAQDFKGYVLNSVIVASDGSTDNTIKVAKSFKNLPLLLFDNTVRQGVAEVQNQISASARSDILVILNADIRIPSKSFIKKLVRPIAFENADLTSGKLEEVDIRNKFEKIIHTSMLVKRVIFEQYKNGNNLYTCCGVARAFSKRFYSKLKYKTSIGEDAYSYFSCLANNFKYIQAKNAIVFYKLPDNMGDHQRQSIRFLQSKQKNIVFFGKELVENEYNIPSKILFLGIINAFRTYPKNFTLYLIIYTYLKIKSVFSSGIQNTWEISTSSKVFNI